MKDFRHLSYGNRAIPLHTFREGAKNLILHFIGHDEDIIGSDENALGILPLFVQLSQICVDGRFDAAQIPAFALQESGVISRVPKGADQLLCPDGSRQR